MIPQGLRSRIIAAAGAGAIGIATVLISNSEGLRNDAYPDVKGIWTACYGETKNIHKGDHFTTAQCKQKLEGRVAEFDAEVGRCLRVELPSKARAAVTDLAYNAGVSAACNSTLMARLNAGDGAPACVEFADYSFAAGVFYRGLLKRRKVEMELCIEGFTEKALDPHRP